MADTCPGCGVDMRDIPDRYEYCISCSPSEHGLKEEPEDA